MTGRNEAGSHTRKQRRARLDDVARAVQRFVARDAAEDRILGLLVVGVYVADVPGGGVEVERHLVAYGEVGVAMLRVKADEALRQASGNLDAATEAAREAVIQGRKPQ